MLIHVGIVVTIYHDMYAISMISPVRGAMESIPHLSNYEQFQSQLLLTLCCRLISSERGHQSCDKTFHTMYRTFTHRQAYMFSKQCSCIVLRSSVQWLFAGETLNNNVRLSDPAHQLASS